LVARVGRDCSPIVIAARELILVSITTTVFTFIGLEFGARLGARYERGAERAAGAMLVMLAALFTVPRLF
jgi:putative Mn2+ efflux pump MntP